MSAYNHSYKDIGEPFRVTLARGLGIPHEGLPIRTIIAEHKHRLVKLDVRRRKMLTESLHQEYCRRRARIEPWDPPAALRTLNEKYTNIQCLVTPIHRLPVEILMNIFYIIFDDHPSVVVLMLVCRRWNNAIEEMPGLQTSVNLCTWTTPGIIRRATSGVASRLLNITIDTDQDDYLGESIIERYSAIALAIESVAQWRSLTVHSLPRGGQLGDSVLHRILSMDILPMTQLEELKITSEVDPSPLVDHLLQSIAGTAMRHLMTIETNCLYSSQYLLRLTSACTFHSLTTLKAILPRTSELIDILPRLTRLEVLEVTNLTLPFYQINSPLPFSQTLHHLYLKSVTIDWMAGRVFPLLSFCAIVTPPSPFLALDVHLPTCREFHFSHHRTALFGRFRVPMVSSLAIYSNHWTPLRGSQWLVDLCMAGLGAVVRPRVLHLAIQCKASVLRMVLQELPALEELNLELPRPSALSRGFFTSLLAKPMTIPYGTRKSGWFTWAENQYDWHASICPCLKVFNLHYQRWLRPNEQIGFVAPLLALGWSRKKTEIPLQTLSVHMKVNHGKWKRVELVSMKPEDLLELDISQLQYLRLDQNALEFVFQAYLTSTTLSVIEGQYGIESIPRLTEAVFGTSFHRIQVLSIHQQWTTKAMLKVLHCFHHLEELSLDKVQIELHSHDVDLPLLQTLRSLSISGGCAKWMDGHTFVQLKYFSVGFISSWHDSFPQRVDMPVCTHISYNTNSLAFMPLFQAAFVFPLMHEWTLQGLFFQDPDWVHALSQVHAQVLRLFCDIETPQLVMAIQPRYELEELSIHLHSHLMAKEFLITLTEVIVDYSLKKPTNTSFDTQSVPELEDAIDHTCNQSERKMICPNLKVLGLQCWIVGDKPRDEVRQWCVNMMEGRRQASFPLERCCIWWGTCGTDWEKEPSLVLFTSNEG